MKTKRTPQKAPAKERRTVGFSITGEFITEHSRRLWQEREYAKAFDVLGCLIGATREQHEAILFGRNKLVGINSLDLVADDWTPPEGYATLAQALTQGKHWPELEKRREGEAEDKLRTAADLKKNGYSGDDAADAQRLIWQAENLVGKERAEEILKACYAEIQEAARSKPYPRGAAFSGVMGGRAGSILDEVANMARGRMMMAGLDPNLIPSADALLNRGTNVKVEECRDMSRTCGWLSPTGKYYGCGTFEHIGLAEKLLSDQYPDAGSNPGGYERLAEKLGWLKISGAGVVQGKSANQKQLDKLHMYAEFHKLDFKNVTKYFTDP